MSTPTLALHDGHSIPALGFGTWPLRGREGARLITHAIGAGYRLLDTAFNYDNEGTVGQAIRDSGVPREDLFVTSKLPGRYHERRDAVSAIQESLWRLGLDYIDLYLIHWPNPERDLYVRAWHGLLEAQQAGLVRSVGVSNFNAEHLERIEAESRVRPVVNQIEIHPYFTQDSLLAHDSDLGIVTQAWSPLGKGTGAIKEPAVNQIAEALGVSPAQVLLRWHVQRGALPIPKSADPGRQIANLDVFNFELSAEQVAAISALGHAGGRRFDGDPNRHEEL